MPFRTAVKNISPGFFRAGTGERYLYAQALLLDGFMQKMVEGTAARWPLRCAPAFLPIIGSDRLINQGLTESVDSYRVRLQKAFESWQIAGSARAVMTQELGYLLSFTPQMRMVSSRYSGNVADIVFVTDAKNAIPIEIRTLRPTILKTGDTVTVSGVGGNTNANTTTAVTVLAPNRFQLDGTVGNAAYTGGGFVYSSVFPSTYPNTLLSSTWNTYTAGQDPKTPPTVTKANPANWDWDSASQVTGSWGWWGSWLIIYSTGSNQMFHKAPKWGSGVKWGAGSAWGVTESALVGRSIQGIAGQWKSANTWIRWIIISFDDTLFDPAQPTGGGVNPDGTFGRWSKLSGGQYVASRFANARYGDGIA